MQHQTENINLILYKLKRFLKLYDSCIRTNMGQEVHLSINNQFILFRA